MSQFGDIPSNSHKSQDETLQPKKPPIPEFNGDVAGVKRKNKRSFLKWLQKMFLSDQKPSDILKSVLENQIVPGIKDNFRNGLFSSIDMFLYTTSKPNSTPSNNISYGKMFNSQSNNTLIQNNRIQNSQQNQSSQDSNGGFTNPCFRDLKDRYEKTDNGETKKIQGAESFLALMKEYDYPTLSVHTLYMMRKKHIDYTWDAYGWTKEEIQNVQIVHINNPDYPWMIDLPPAHVITN